MCIVSTRSRCMIRDKASRLQGRRVALRSPRRCCEQPKWLDARPGGGCATDIEHAPRCRGHDDCLRAELGRFMADRARKRGKCAPWRKRAPWRKEMKRVNIELGDDGPVAELPDGVVWESESRTVRCESDDPLVLIVSGGGKGNAHRGGTGDGHVVRNGSGDGDATREGSGFGDATRDGHGDGNAIRDGDGEGNAVRMGFGDGDAIRRGSGFGDAINTGYRLGDAIRGGSGDGNAHRKDGDGNAIREGQGSGDARRYPGVGNAYHRSPQGSSILIAETSSSAYHLGNRRTLKES